MNGFKEDRVIVDERDDWGYPKEGREEVVFSNLPKGAEEILKGKTKTALFSSRGNRVFVLPFEAGLVREILNSISN